MANFLRNNQRMRPCLWQKFLNAINCIYTESDDLDLATYHIHTVKGGISGPLQVAMPDEDYCSSLHLSTGCD